MEVVIRLCEQSMPLSLKQSCVLYAVVNIDKYPVSLLARLPISIRRMLLTYLPGVNIHRLEGTEFLQGIDIESIWYNLYLHYKPKLPVPFNDQAFVKRPFFADPESDDNSATASASINGKEMILESAVRSVLGYDKTSPIKCTCRHFINLPFAVLLTVRNLACDEPVVNSNASPSLLVLLNYLDITVVCPELGIVVAKEHGAITNGQLRFGTNSHSDLVQFLMSTFDKYPKIINSSQLQHAIIKNNKGLFMEFLSRMEALCLSGGGESLDMILSCAKGFTTTNSLKTLLVNTELCEDQLHNIAPYFSLRNKMVGTAYNKLEQLSAGKFLKHEMQPTEAKNPLVDVSSIISAQKNLRKVRLYGYFGYSSASEGLMSALCKLAKQCSFESLIIEGQSKNCKCSIEKFSKLMIRFLCSNSEHMTFTNFQLVETATTSMKMTMLSLSSTSIPPPSYMKSLDITGVYLPDSVIQLLERVQKCSFRMLALSVSAATEYYIHLPNFFNSIKYVLTQSSEQFSPSSLESISRQISYFITKPDVQWLTLRSISLSNSSVCEAISQALISEVSINRSLTVIHLIDCFDGIKTDCLKLIFEGLISLAQAVKLEVKFEGELYISGTKFMTHEHVDVLSNVWTTMATGSTNQPLSKIHKLQCTLFNAGEDQLLKMEEVVENLGVVFKHTEHFEKTESSWPNIMFVNPLHIIRASN